MRLIFGAGLQVVGSITHICHNAKFTPGSGRQSFRRLGRSDDSGGSAENAAGCVPSFLRSRGVGKLEFVASCASQVGLSRRGRP